MQCMVVSILLWCQEFIQKGGSFKSAASDRQRLWICRISTIAFNTPSKLQCRLIESYVSYQNPRFHLLRIQVGIRTALYMLRNSNIFNGSRIQTPVPYRSGSFGQDKNTVLGQSMRPHYQLTHEVLCVFDVQLEQDHGSRFLDDHHYSSFDGRALTSMRVEPGNNVTLPHGIAVNLKTARVRRVII